MLFESITITTSPMRTQLEKQVLRTSVLTPEQRKDLKFDIEYCKSASEVHLQLGLALAAANTIGDLVDALLRADAETEKIEAHSGAVPISSVMDLAESLAEESFDSARGTDECSAS